VVSATAGERCDVTVVIPTRNRLGFLAGALRSALAQADVSYEVRVIDDGSTDGTAELLKSCRDRRVIAIRHPSPRGVAAARNRGAAGAAGEWLAFLDDDDLWAPTWLRSGLETARARGAGAVYGSRWIVDERRLIVGSVLAREPSQVHALLADHNSLGGPSSVIVRADVMAAAGGFDKRLSAFADWEAWFRVLDLCKAAAVPELLTAYTVYPGNMHVRDPFGVGAEFEIFARIVANSGGTINTVNREGFMRWLATGSNQAGRRTTAARIWLRNAVRTRNARDVLRAARALRRDGIVHDAQFAAPAWIEAARHGAIVPSVDCEPGGGVLRTGARPTVLGG
jgi:glycosyltransferase involved in cell wall biosynthesis